MQTYPIDEDVERLNFNMYIAVLSLPKSKITDSNSLPKAGILVTLLYVLVK